MIPLDICFVDYVYPRSCGEDRWGIVDILINVFTNITTGVTPNYVCIPSDIVYSKTVDLNAQEFLNCVAFLGIEPTTLSQLSNQEFTIVGPVYNYSRDFVLPFDNSSNTIQNNLYDGWGFVYAFDWSVWCGIVSIIISAFFIQLFMKYTTVDSSPGLTKESLGEIASRSVMSTIGYSRLYQGGGGDRNVLTRHLLSCCMAIFSFIFISLYSSNLINYFFVLPGSENRIPEVFSVGVHPALKDIVSLETFKLFSGHRQSLRIINMVPNAVYEPGSVPVVTRTIGESLRNFTISLVSLGGYQTIYEVFLRRDLVYTIAANTSQTVQSILDFITKEIKSFRSKEQLKLNNLIDRDSCDTRRLRVIQVTDVYGVFVILFVGYALSILYRVFFTKKKGLATMVLYKKSVSNDSDVVESSSASFNDTVVDMSVDESPASSFNDTVVVDMSVVDKSPASSLNDTVVVDMSIVDESPASDIIAPGIQGPLSADRRGPLYLLRRPIICQTTGFPEGPDRPFGYNGISNTKITK